MSRKHKNFTQEQKDLIVELHLDGLSSRAICRKIGINEKKKSSINYFLADWRLEEKVEDTSSPVVKEKDEFTLDEVSDSVLGELIKGDDKSYANLAKRLRTAQNTNNQLRKIHRGTVDPKGDDGSAKTFEDMLNTLSDNLTGKFYSYKEPAVQQRPANKTVEILFSDLQIGKISESWNTEIAINTLKYYGQEVLKEVVLANPERIIFSSLGDVCECMLKHGIQSAISTDTSNAEQMANAIEHIWWSVLAPLIDLGIPMEIVGVQGNHLSSTAQGMDMFKAGRYGYDYAIYKAWENLCRVAKADHVTFNLPEGHFATYEIYGKLTVAEHGYSCKGSSEAAMINLRNKRSANLQKFVHRLVVGDMHHLCNYDNANLQVNGAFFGVAFDAIEYSGIMGFHAVPCQVLNIHAPTTGVGQNTVLETKVIQVAKGYNLKG